MGNENIIETGVDRLLALIESKDRVSLSEAAKHLSVPKQVVEEWVNFLEDKELIHIQYKFTIPYLMKKQVSEKEVAIRTKEFEGRKEGFVRKVESTLASIETETSGLREAQSDFKKFSDSIEAQLGKVKKELDTLEKYDGLKKDIDDEIIKQQATFEARVMDLKDEVETKKHKYDLIDKKVVKEEDILDKEKSRADGLLRREKELIGKLASVKEEITELGDTLSSEDKVIQLEEKHIKDLHDEAENLRTELKDRKEGIQKLVDQSKAKEDEIFDMQKKVLDKIAEESKKIHGKVVVSKEAKRKFTDFFEKKVQMDIIMDKVTNDLSTLQQQLKGLITEAHAVDFTKKKANAKEHANKLEKKFQEIQKKKTAFQGEVGKLNKLFKGLKK